GWALILWRQQDGESILTEASPGVFHHIAFHQNFFFSSRRRHTRSKRDWSSDVCSSDLVLPGGGCGHDAHAASSAWRSRMRGSRYPTRMSMRKLMTTKNSPMIMTTATIALRSLRRMTWTP